MIRRNFDHVLAVLVSVLLVVVFVIENWTVEGCTVNIFRSNILICINLNVTSGSLSSLGESTTSTLAEKSLR